MSLQQVCEELDELAVNYFQVLEELSEQRRCFEKHTKEGFLNLSKARFSMGNGAVSSLQYDTTSMCALAHITTKAEGDCHTFEVVRTKAMKRSERKSLEGSESGGNQHNSDTTDNTAVRRRKPPSSTPEDPVETLTADLDQLTTPSSSSSSSPGEPSRQRVPTDPLLWFGVLVPQPLRHGQQNFVDAIDACSVMAALQTRLDAAYAQYRSKLQEKHRLLKKSEAATGPTSSNGAIPSEDTH